MPGIIVNQQNNILAHPASFDPFDSSLFEWLIGDEAPDEDTFAFDNGHGFMAGYLKDTSRLFDALTYFVGYSELDRTGGQVNQFKVKRWNPAVHPRWPMWRCSQVSIKGVKFSGTTSVLRTFPDGSRRLPCPNYQYYRFDIAWDQPQVTYLNDSDPSFTSEWDRCLKTDSEDDTEVVTVDGGFYRLNAPSIPDVDGSPPTFNGPSFRVYAQRSGLVVKSFGLPADFIVNQYGVPTNLLDGKGKVNSTTFLGLPAGTVLFQGYQIDKVAQPVATQSVSALQFGLTVTLKFSYTNPTPAEAGETLRGWQLVPAIASGAGLGWYGVRSAPKYGSHPLYDTYDHNKLLQYVGS